MPVSGNEEPGVKPFSQQFSSSIAGIPIKKRRYPLVKTPSLPSEAESDSRPEDNSESSRGTSLPIANVESAGTVLSSGTKESSLEQKRERSDAEPNTSFVQSNVELSEVRLEEPSPSLLNTLKGKPASIQPVVNAVAGNTGVQLMQVEIPSVSVVKEFEDKFGVDNKLKVHQTELSLGPKEPSAPTLAYQKSERGSHEQDNLCHCTLGLSLSKGEDIANDKHDSVDPMIESSQPPTDRCNWNLNEPMDAWEGSTVDELVGRGTGVDGVNRSCVLRDIKPFICLPKVIGPGVSLGKQISVAKQINEEGYKLKVSASSMQFGSEDFLSLCLSPSCLSPNISRELSVLSAKIDSGKTFSNLLKVIGPGVSLGKQISLAKQINEEGYKLKVSASSMQCGSEDSLSLCLSPSCLSPNISQELSGLSAKIDSGKTFSNLSTLSKSVLPRYLHSMGYRSIKPEPFDESLKQDLKQPTANIGGGLDCGTAKHQLVEKPVLESSQKSDIRTFKLVEGRPVKSEPVHDGNEELIKQVNGTTYQLDGHSLQTLETSSSSGVSTAMLQVPCPSDFSTCSKDLSINADTSTNSQYSTITKEMTGDREVPQETSESVEQVTSETVFLSMGRGGKELGSSDYLLNSSSVKELGNNDIKQCEMKLVNELPHDSHDNGGGCASDEEMINIPGDTLEEEFSESESESDGNQALASGVDPNTKKVSADEDDYEDGEVREPLLHADVGGSTSDKTEEDNAGCDHSGQKLESLGGAIGVPDTSLNVREKDKKPEGSAYVEADDSKNCDETILDRKELGIDKDSSLAKPVCIEIPTCVAEKRTTERVIRRRILDRSGKRDSLKGHGAGASDATDQSQGSVVAGGQGINEMTKGSELGGKSDPNLPQKETVLHRDEGAKESSGGGSRSRIITLPRASNTSPLNARSMSGRSLTSRTGRDRRTDLEFEGDKLHSRGSRDEIYADGSLKFFRERNQDQALRNSRLSFIRGRERGSNRVDAVRGDWDSDRDFATEHYDGPEDFRLSRRKFISPVSDIELETCTIAPDGAVAGTGRGGRKPLNDEAPVFRHLSLRRRSPGGREGPTMRSIPMVHRLPRNISPSRCIQKDNSELVGLRHNQKFVRGAMSDDMVDPLFARSQLPYEGVEGHLIRSERNFPTIQRRCIPRARSKSPIRSRTRSPCPWSSPRRRTPDGFEGHPYLGPRRSPIYRMERMRSPDRACYLGEIVGRRHVSPPYLCRTSDDLRDIDSLGDNSHVRPIMPYRRSPSGRILPRGPRRYDIIEPRERTEEGNEFIVGPLHSGRFHDLAGDGNGDERKKFDGRGPVRSIRPPFTGGDDENFRFRVDSGPRVRFCPDGDLELHERGNLREREFYRRTKGRTGNISRTTRNSEEQDGNYGHGAQVWHEDGFDDVSRVKRRRF
ncbi:hypothetical protein RJ641_036167 [Dillenia turbinata]|uniref:Uncharacterized protein n=1 Tax=Dillenia turbinata TaxID=194707 RepID=A0AAN8ZGN9_9MAGN